MLRLAFDFIITWRETRTRPNAYSEMINLSGSNWIHNKEDKRYAPRKDR
ncbi:hypothetical protein M097_0055 [Phocaeicola vulgatus str. 3775 SL(B) 10 (iv)]|uniref:Uncharacterized protein n=1 Tax=Phocaeicola vulgatus str. 3775 SL(B) 10 (iv) TaxID=1339350 RepID=A0A078REP3_PHOVU|nr:hypothetical protein M098_3131 [Phocaeicola vulgatus str. 3775 SR(B) 19]KDS33795.1 hypothetical protein M097_0055 [Phocaeicola vulgatus str. 3775 SL(B) 10 (iv)]